MNITLLKLFIFTLIVAVTVAEEDNPEDFQRATACNWMNDNPGNSPHITVLNYGFKIYYVIRNFRLNWLKAYAYCRSNGLSLASPSTKQQNEFLINALISKNLTSTGKKDQYWISLTDVFQNKSFVWMSTGEKVTYTNWHVGEPNNGKNDELGYEHCGELWTKNLNNTKWNDWHCLCPQNFICEIN